LAQQEPDTKLTVNRKNWIVGVAIGVFVGLVVAFIMTFLDWRLNPGGIFHNAQGTNWTVVADTAISWFAPMSIIVSATALLLIFLFVILK